MSQTVTCERLIGFLHDYLADELESSQRRAFDRHLELCPSCRAYLETYQTTVELGRAALVEEPAPPLPDDLVQAILAARKA